MKKNKNRRIRGRQKEARKVKKIVILGGGYGGMMCISDLLKGHTKEPFQIILVDRMPHHTLKTEFFALAAGSVTEKHINVQFPNHPKLQLVQGEVENIDTEKKQVVVHSHEPISYDYLVVGLGCEDNYHGLEGAKEHTVSVQTPWKALEALEKVKQLQKPANIIVIGGGLTGVELASELQEHYPKHNVHILEHGKTILAPFSPRIQNHAKKWFAKKGVNITNEVHSEKIEEGKVHYNGGQTITGKLIFWAGGIQASHIVTESGFPLERGKVVIDENTRVKGYEDVFVIGDCALAKLPASAQLAEQHGVIAGKTIRALLNGETPSKGKQPRSKGMMGSLGKYNGFGSVFGISLTGFVPRVIKYGINVYYKWIIK